MKELTFFLFIIAGVSGILSLISFRDFERLKSIIKDTIKPAPSLIEELRMLKTFHYIFFTSLFLLILFINLTYFT